MNHYTVLLFVLPTILYGVSWYTYHGGVARDQRADTIYYVALVLQIILMLGIVLAGRKPSTLNKGF